MSPYDLSAYGSVLPNEQTWELVLTARARRVYVFGGDAPSSRVLSKALGLEPVAMQAARYTRWADIGAQQRPPRARTLVGISQPTEPRRRLPMPLASAGTGVGG